MTVHFIGAGPGAADLLTLRARDLIAAADVCIYAGALVPQEVLSWAPDHAVLIDSQHLVLDDIIDHMVAAARAGKNIVRLHSGDPSLYSAIAEQARRLDEAGVAFDICPGVPAWSAAAAALGRELTVPEVAQSIVLTRISRRATAMPAGETLENFAKTGATIVVHLAVQAIDEVVAELSRELPIDTPVAVCAYVSQPREVLLRSTLANIANDVAEAGIKRTAVIIVGKALTAHEFTTSHLYSCERQREIAQ